jgi:Flp pilus assembly pilin Flp
MLSDFLRDERGASAAELALLLPLFLMFLLGTIDAGRYIWAVNQAEKATQIGARWAVATQLIPGGDDADGLLEYSFLDDGVETGTAVGVSHFPGVSCATSGANVSCSCKSGGTCNFDYAATSAVSRAAWAALVKRMQQIDPDLKPANIQIDYDNSGLGYAGDPNGPDVAPLVTVSLRNLRFKPIALFLFNASLPIPSASYSLTLEDGQGTTSN